MAHRRLSLERPRGQSRANCVSTHSALNNKTPTAEIVGKQRKFNVTYQQNISLTAALRLTLVDNDKVLKALNDRAEHEVNTFIASIGTDGIREHERYFTVLSEAMEQLWEVMRDAYSQGPDFEYPETNKRRHLRQALRTLNLGARAVNALLKRSAFEHEGHFTYRNSPRYRLSFAKTALTFAQSFAGKCSPGPQTYNHPQFSKWHKLCAQAKRRIAALYLDDARESEATAEAGPGCMQKERA